MKRSERINSLLIYLNDKSEFHLKDLMETYAISKSTALRDIETLEDLGMPIYSEPGRYGRYGILKNKLLSPIIFTVDEMYALYFAMLTLASYQSTPFHLRLPDLKSKLKESISRANIDTLLKMEEILQFENTRHFNSSPLLKEIVDAAIEQAVCEIVYIVDDAEITATVQFRHINSRFGQWYVTGFNFATRKMRVFRCDRIKRLKQRADVAPVPLEMMAQAAASSRRDGNVTQFKVEITKKGIDLFSKENYPSMTLVERNDRYFIEGAYQEEEERFIARYFLNYGEHVRSVTPAKLQNSIRNLIAELQQQYSKQIEPL